MPFNPPTPSKAAAQLASLPKIEQGVPFRPLGSPRAIDRHEFYSALQPGDSFIAPNKAFADHALAWARKNDRKFAKRIEPLAKETFRVWRLS